MNELELIRIYNTRLYVLDMSLYVARGSAYPRAVAYDGVGGSHGQVTSQIENAYERASEIATKMIKLKTKRDRLAEEIKRAAYRAEISEREWFAVRMYYIVPNSYGKPFKWSDVASSMGVAFGIGDRQAYNYRRSGCNKILKTLE